MSESVIMDSYNDALIVGRNEKQRKIKANIDDLNENGNDDFGN